MLQLRSRPMICLLSLIVAAQGLRGEESSKPQPNSDSPFPQLPEFSLTAPGNTDPAAVIAKAIESAASESRPVTKARYLLAAANFILARQLEPVCSTGFSNISSAGSSSNEESIRQSLDQAAAHIRNAREVLASIGKEPEPNDAEKPAEAGNTAPTEAETLIHSADALQSFLDGQRAFLLPESDAGSRRKAASALAPFLEDPDPKVAAAARLWQALLRSLEADPAAALHILESSAEPASADAWPFGLFGRVLQFRLKGVQGAWSTALVQLIRMEDQLENWVPDLSKRGDARRLFARVRLEVLQRWYDSFDQAHSAERTWCVLRSEEVIKSYFSVETSLLRLDPAVPEMVTLDVARPQEQGAEPK